MTVKVEDDAENYEKLMKELEYLSSHVIHIGVLSDDEVDGITVKEYSLYLEFGTEHIPARPFFRTATQTQKARNKIADYMENELEEVINLNKTAKQAMDATGMYVKGLIQKSILDGDWTDNAPGTIAQKGKNQPLVDTTTLLKSIDYEIKKRSEV